MVRSVLDCRRIRLRHRSGRDWCFACDPIPVMRIFPVPRQMRSGRQAATCAKDGLAERLPTRSIIFRRCRLRGESNLARLTREHRRIVKAALQSGN